MLGNWLHRGKIQLQGMYVFEVLGTMDSEEVVVGQVVCEGMGSKETREGTLLGMMDSMNCWNVRGINCLSKQKDGKKFFNIRSLGLVSLIETKVKIN